MDLEIKVEASAPGAELRSLRSWLVGDPVLRGRVRLVLAAPEPGTLGSAVEVVAVALGPGGVATALASVLIAWVRRRVGDVTVKITRPDGSSIEVEAKNLRDATTAAVRELVVDIATSLDSLDGKTGDGGR